MFMYIAKLPQSEVNRVLVMQDNDATEMQDGYITRRKALQVAGAAGVAALAGCTGGDGGDGDGSDGEGNGNDGGSTSGSSDAKTVTDLLGREVEVPETVESILGLESSALREISHMGAADLVAGVEEREQGWAQEIPYNMANPRFQDVPVIGPRGGDPELVAQQDPDVIFMVASKEPVTEMQRKTDIPVLGLPGGDLEKQRTVLYDSWRTIGEVLDEQDRAETLIEYTDETVADFDERTKDASNNGERDVLVSGLNFRGPGTLTTILLPYPPLKWLNTESVAHGKFPDVYEKGEYLGVTVSDEKFLQWDPGTLFLDLSNLGLARKTLEKKPEFEELSAIQNDRVYGLHPFNQYNNNLTCTLANGYYMGTVLYPDQFSDVDPEEKADEIYETYLGEPVYDQVADVFGGYRTYDLTS